MSKIKIAITGGIGSGKSTVLNYVKDLGFDTFSCDEISPWHHALRDSNRVPSVGQKKDIVLSHLIRRIV